MTKSPGQFALISESVVSKLDEVVDRVLRAEIRQEARAGFEPAKTMYYVPAVELFPCLN